MSDRKLLSTIKDAILNKKTIVLCVIFSAYELYCLTLYSLIAMPVTWSLTATSAQKSATLFVVFIFWICIITAIAALIMKKWEWKQWLITLPFQFVVYLIVGIIWPISLSFLYGGPHSVFLSFILSNIYLLFDISIELPDIVTFIASCIEIFAIQALGIYLYNRRSERRERRAMRANEAKEAEKRSDTEQNKAPAPSEEDNKD